MNKKEYIKLVADKLGKTQKDVEEVLTVMLETIEETLLKGESVKLSGFGTFEVSERAARKGRNPATGESILIQASKSAKFKPAKALKDLLNDR